MIQAYLLWETTFHPFVNCLQSSMPRCLYTSMALHLQRASRAPGLYTSMLPRLHACTPARLQRDSRALELHTSMPPRCYAYIAPPELHSSMRRCRHACSAPSYLYLHVATPAARLQSSM